MTQLEVRVIDNYLAWFETSVKKKLKLKILAIQGAYLQKLWAKEHKCTKEQAQKEMGKLILNVVYGIKEENK